MADDNKDKNINEEMKTDEETKNELKEEAAAEGNEEGKKEAISKNEGKSEAAQNRGRTILALCIAAIALACFVFPLNTLKGNFFSSPEEAERQLEKKRLTAAVIKDKLIQQSKLITYSEEFVVRLNFSNNGKIPWTNFKFPGGKREFSMIIPITVDITTDLEKLEVEFNEDTDTVSVACPFSEIFRITPDLSRLETTEDIGLFRSKMTAEEQKQLILEAEKVAEEAIEEKDMIDIANMRAQKTLTELVKKMGVKNVEVTTIYNR